MFSPVVTLAAFVVLAALSAGGLAYALLFRRISDDAQAERRRNIIQDRPTNIAAVKARLAADPAKRRKNVQDTLREMEIKEKARSRSRASPPLEIRLQQAGLPFGRRGFLVASAISGVLAFALVFLLRAPLYAAAGIGVVAALGLPIWFVNTRRKRRFKRFLAEFPTAVDIIVRGIKAGLPLNDCLRIIANEAAEPVRSEFRLITESQQVGLTIADAVARMPERVPLAEANFFSIVISIQAKAGGNLAEALGNLSKVLRERAKMAGKIRALSMEARASAVIIGVLPLVVMALVYITSPDYIMMLFQERTGHIILGSSVVWASLGIFIMKRMINFDY